MDVIICVSCLLVYFVVVFVKFVSLMKYVELYRSRSRTQRGEEGGFDIKFSCWDFERECAWIKWV